MINRIIVESTFMLILVLQALYNYYNFKDANSSSSTFAEDQNKWHLYQAIAYFLEAFLIAYLTNDLILLPILLFERAIIFQNGLNIIRKKNFFYLGVGNSFDDTIRKYFGNNGGIVLFIFSLIFFILLNLLTIEKLKGLFEYN